MNPTLGVGQNAAVRGKWLQNADIEALDVMGYTVDFSTIIPPLGDFENVTPSTGPVLASGFNMNWDVVSGAFTYAGYVKDQSGNVVFSITDLSLPSFAVPSSVLMPGQILKVVLAAQNPGGLRTFSVNLSVVAGQQCDSIDFNNNTVFPEDQDVIDFFSVLAGEECAVCNDIDFNNNTVFPEDQDVIDFFRVLAGGTCP
jgi:hypothetical protein